MSFQEKLHLKSVLDDMRERHRRQMDELSSSVETSKERHQQEIAAINNKQEEALTMLKKVAYFKHCFFSVQAEGDLINI